MPRRFPTLTTTSALALAAAVAPVSLAAHALVSSGHSATAPGFKISGRLAGPLAPGVSQPLNLRLSNRSRHRLLITKLTRVAEARRRPPAGRLQPRSAASA